MIAPDEPIEVRRKNLLGKRKYRAEHAGKRVVVNDGVLIIDAEFLLVGGFLHTNNRHG